MWEWNVIVPVYQRQRSLDKYKWGVVGPHVSGLEFEPWKSFGVLRLVAQRHVHGAALRDSWCTGEDGQATEEMLVTAAGSVELSWSSVISIL